MTLEQVRRIGITALAQKLGTVGMVRFLQQSETGWGDYTKERKQWLGNPDLKELFDAVKDSEESNT
ncbi:MAG: hypothetical protein D3905_15185 [Candidatus Electrothrix sp. AS4_5]|nr:hypothetical protein [Candidatus Electrothrix gigas]MCI5226431.1 hypothetical protein [Candidatus Electrothrix gigas]